MSSSGGRLAGASGPDDRRLTVGRLVRILVGSVAGALLIVLVVLALGLFLAAAFEFSVELGWAGVALEGGDAFGLEVDGRIVVPIAALAVVLALAGVATARRPRR